ncbi:MAG: hypothetical protein KF681_08450 [Bdellovibrionaceae bacterium]|nr:hypothetical protein [Pseudobdellovibrionaceae bacterium]
MKKEYDLKKMRARKGPARVYPEAKKATITMRIDAITLGDLKTEAERLGIPYQTLAQSILHRFVTGELVDKKSRAG